MTAPRRTLDEIVTATASYVGMIHGTEADIRAACVEYAAGEVAALLATLRDIVEVGTPSEPWQVEGCLESVVDIAKDALAKHGGGK